MKTLDYYRIKNPPARFSFKDRVIFTQNNQNDSLLVEIACFCLMPNHFHLLIRQIEENGITRFLSKVTNSYTKYFNTKHDRIGPLFQGSFKAVRIEDDNQLIHVSRYIHLNPLIGYFVKDLKTYQYSSYPQFIGQTTGFCQILSVLSHFSSPQTYEKFILDQEDYGRKLKEIERVLIEIDE